MDKEKHIKKEDATELKKRIKYLEEELVRKQNTIDHLKNENLILFRTALKRSEEKVNRREKSQDNEKDDGQ